VVRGDVLVDIGAGRGRVLNYWLRAFPHNQIIGLEADATLARAVARRLRKRAPRCSVIHGIAPEDVPLTGSVYFMYNPFAADILEAVVDRLITHVPEDVDLRILYYNPKHLAAVDTHPRLTIDVTELGGGRIAPYDELAVLRRTPTICSGIAEPVPTPP